MRLSSRDTGAENLKTISTPAAKDTRRETEEEKRHDLKERRVNEKLGSKMNDDDKDEALSRRGDKIQVDCRTCKLLGTRQDGHRMCCEGSNEANDSAHDRRLKQTRPAGKTPCPI